jgi:hypothetical protein
MALFIVILYWMQTRFYIEKRKDEAGKLLVKGRPVFMSVSFPGDRLLLSTGIKANYHEGDPVPLYTQLTAGMGVNTFLANAIRLDIPLEVISGYTGV